MDLISAPVISGFCSAAALTVASTQMKGLLGLKFKGSHFLDVWGGVYAHFSEINRWDAGLGLSAIVLLLCMRVMNENNSKLTSIFMFFFFFVAAENDGPEKHSAAEGESELSAESLRRRRHLVHGDRTQRLRRHLRLHRRLSARTAGQQAFYANR